MEKHVSLHGYDGNIWLHLNVEYGKQAIQAECNKFQAGFKTSWHFLSGLYCVPTFYALKRYSRILFTARGMGLNTGPERGGGGKSTHSVSLRI
jgi:hypothetical protein